MALNCSMLRDMKPVPLPNELTLINVPSGVDLSLVIPAEPPAGSSGASESAGNSGSPKMLRGTGAIWLTDQRLIFTSKALSPSISSLSVLLPSILSTNFHQPIFSSNYLSITIKPSIDGGLVEGTMAEIRFNDRAMFEFVSLLDKTREKAIYMKRQMREEEDMLPTYTSGGGSTPVPDYNPPSYDATVTIEHNIQSR